MAPSKTARFNSARTFASSQLGGRQSRGLSDSFSALPSSGTQKENFRANTLAAPSHLAPSRDSSWDKGCSSLLSRGRSFEERSNSINSVSEPIRRFPFQKAM